MSQLRESASPKKREEIDSEIAHVNKPQTGYSHWGMPIAPSPHKKTRSHMSMFKAETNYDMFSRQQRGNKM